MPLHVILGHPSARRVIAICDVESRMIARSHHTPSVPTYSPNETLFNKEKHSRRRGRASKYSSGIFIVAVPCIFACSSRLLIEINTTRPGPRLKQVSLSSSSSLQSRHHDIGLYVPPNRYSLYLMSSICVAGHHHHYHHHHNGHCTRCSATV